jgi:hypothetical protein
MLLAHEMRLFHGNTKWNCWMLELELFQVLCCELCECVVGMLCCDGSVLHSVEQKASSLCVCVSLLFAGPQPVCPAPANNPACYTCLSYQWAHSITLTYRRTDTHTHIQLPEWHSIQLYLTLGIWHLTPDRQTYRQTYSHGSLHQQTAATRQHSCPR